MIRWGGTLLPSGSRAGDGMARCICVESSLPVRWVPQPVLVSEEKATGLLAPHKLFANACAVQKAICRL